MSDLRLETPKTGFLAMWLILWSDQPLVYGYSSHENTITILFRVYYNPSIPVHKIPWLFIWYLVRMWYITNIFINEIGTTNFAGFYVVEQRFCYGGVDNSLFSKVHVSTFTVNLYKLDELLQKKKICILQEYK